jgi:hypothetical protein
MLRLQNAKCTRIPQDKMYIHENHLLGSGCRHMGLQVNISHLLSLDIHDREGMVCIRFALLTLHTNQLDT